MTLRDAITLIDTAHYVRLADLEVRVWITDVKTAYGEIKVRVTPCDGKGEKWVNLSSVYDH